MCPKLWGQLFIVCGQLTKDIWIPLAFGFLPDKKKQTYRAFFNQLKDAMDQIGESLSAEYVMCDFEIGIRNSLREVWPEMIVKGCHFHMAKALWKRVVDAGLKTEYSTPGNDNLVALVVAAIGMAYVPIDQLEKAFDIMKKIASQLPSGKQKKFGKSFLSYFKKTWMDKSGDFPPSDWNFYNFKGVTTNNFNEGYNNRFNNFILPEQIPDFSIEDRNNHTIQIH